MLSRYDPRTNPCYVIPESETLNGDGYKKNLAAWLKLVVKKKPFYKMASSERETHAMGLMR